MFICFLGKLGRAAVDVMAFYGKRTLYDYPTIS